MAFVPSCLASFGFIPNRRRSFLAWWRWGFQPSAGFLYRGWLCALRLRPTQVPLLARASPVHGALRLGLVLRPTSAPPSFLRLSASGLTHAPVPLTDYQMRVGLLRQLSARNKRIFSASNTHFLFSVLPRLGSATHSSKKWVLMLLIGFDRRIFRKNEFAMKKLKESRFSLREINRLNNHEVRSKSVQVPSAQSTTLCGLGSATGVGCFCYERDVLQNKELPIVIKAVVELQYRFALRISEVLSIRSVDISHNGKIRIMGLKGSYNRIVEPLDFKQFWLDNRESLLPLISVYSRFYFYRAYKTLGWFSTFGNSKVNSVTHYFRHLQGIEIMNEWQDIELTQRSLGHKSTNSTQYYVRKERK